MLPSLPERYRPSRRIGEGATAVVWQAEDCLLDTEVAVKVVKPHLAMHRRFRSSFAREVALSTRVVHPHIVPVHDTGMLPTGEPFVALGYAAGGSLADLLRLRPAVDEVLRLMDEILDALAALHARALLHQDLKPANVLLYPGTDGQVHAWVADLGVADALAELNRDRKGISGTPAYMAPEQLSGDTQELGPWTDLYAVGLMLHEILSGERPHLGEDRPELLKARLCPPPRLPLGGNFGNALAQVIETLLHPDPRQRFDRAADARMAIKNAIRGISFSGQVALFHHSSNSSASTGPVLLSGATPLSVILPEHPHAGTLRWNRVSPSPMPVPPPPSHGWQAPARASLALFSLREVPLVGRQREREVLWEAARTVASTAKPQVVLVVGERSSGKSRLLEDLGYSLEEGGWMEVVRLKYHSPPGVDDGYRGAVRDLLVPWNDSHEGIELRLRRWLSRDRQVPGEAVAEEAAILSRWCGYLREGELPVNEAEGLAYLYRYLDTRSWRGGSCLLLQDVHHAQADGDGLAIAEALLDRTVGERPVLVVATLDAAALQQDAQLRQKVEGLQERGALRIGLPRLTLAETRKVVDESLILDPELARLVAIEYEGNPLGAGLVLRDWALRKLLLLDDKNRYSLRRDVGLEEALPGSVAVLADRRLESTLASAPDAAAAREALFAAALSGVEPPCSPIRAISDAGMDGLLASGILSERNGCLVFEHARVRDAAVTMASRSSTYAATHQKLATAWEQSSGEMDVDLALGQHRLRGGQPEAALAPLLASVRRMNQGGRARAAIRIAAMAIEAADRVGNPDGRLEARRLHAQALVEVGEPERALPLIDHALTEVENGDRLERARLRVLWARAARQLGRIEDANRELNTASQVFQSLRDRRGMIEVAIQRARLARVQGQHAEEIRFWGETLRLNRDDYTVEAEARNGMVQALVHAGQLGHIDNQLRRLEAAARVGADVRRMAEASWTTALVHIERRELDQAERLLSGAAATAATLGADSLLLRCRTSLAEVARFRGDRVRAAHLNRQLVRFCVERGWLRDAAAARTQLALLALSDGNLLLVHEEVLAAEAALLNVPLHALWLHVGILRAVLAAESGDAQATHTWWEVARQRGIEERHVPDLWLPLERLGRAARLHGWEDIASRALARLATETGAEDVVVDIEEN